MPFMNRVAARSASATTGVRRIGRHPTRTVIKLKPVSANLIANRRSVLDLLRSLHSVPGRLRIKADVLRRTSTANAAQAGIASLGGVNSATVNVVTGSLLITYDPMRLRANVVWTKLRELGVVSGSMPAPEKGSVGQLAEGLSRQMMINIGAEILSRAVLALLA